MSLYGLIIGLAIIVGLQYFSHHNTLVPKSQENKFVLVGIIISIIGARTYHILDSWTYYSQNPAQIINLPAGGLGIYGALIFGLIYVYFYTHLYHISLIQLLNSITPVIPLCQAIGRLGNFVNQEIPHWWLEACLNLILFLLLKLFPRHSFAKYLIGYGLIRFIFEFFRADTWTVGPIKIAQIISIIFIILGSSLLYAQTKSQSHRHLDT